VVFRVTLLSLSPEFLAALHLVHCALLVFVWRPPAVRVSEKAVRALRECPHLKIEIWRTRFCGFNLDMDHPSLGVFIEDTILTIKNYSSVCVVRY
jgi:hypothetical protein